MTVSVRLYQLIPAPGDGNYLRSYDPEANSGRGDIKLTRDPALAMQFADAGEVLRLRQAVPKCHPYRSDGMPNRPLSAYSLEIEAVP